MPADKFELDLSRQEPDLPELREIVVEASRALALLDAVRLEEMALSCPKLIRNLGSMEPAERAELARQAREACGDMAVFARVLEATRANLNVMHRLRDLREGRLEYACPQHLLSERIHGVD
jgi:hypothetical protein